MTVVEVLEGVMVLKFWRSRWAEMSRLTRYGFWIAVVAAVMGLSLTGAWVASDYSGPWQRLSNATTAMMFGGLVIQGVGHWRDRRVAAGRSRHL